MASERWLRLNGTWHENGVPCRVAPVQVNGREGSVPWEVSAEAWKEYAAQGHGSQSHERICERKGWGAAELAILLFQRVKRLEEAAGGDDWQQRACENIEAAALQECRRAIPEDIRAAGWAVAVHNDYRLAGVPHTFWLFTRGDRCVKGEGRTDAEALDQVRAAIGALADERGGGAGRCSCGGELVRHEGARTPQVQCTTCKAWRWP